MNRIIAQHGPAKGKKITNGLEANSLSGVIFSPNDERFESILTYSESDDRFNADNVFLDPQFYYSTFSNNILKKLNDIDYFPTDVTRRDWRNKSSKIIDYIDIHATNSQLISNTLIAPGFYIDNIDWHFDYSVDIYNYCTNNYSFNHYALSLLINASFFNNKKNMEELLDELEDLCERKDYIYLTICHDINNDENNYEIMDINSLGNLMSFIFRLKKKGFKFIIGYSFMNSLLFAMIGCEFIASGWFNSLRKFQKGKFEISDTFGRRKKRYASIPLLSYIMFDDLNQMFSTDLITKEDIISNTSFDSQFLNNESSLSFVDLELEYWEALKNVISKIDEIIRIEDRINYVQGLIIEAYKKYQKVCQALELADEQEALKRIKANSKHLLIWQAAIDLFKNNELFI